MTTAETLTIADVLDVEYPGVPSWSADGTHLATTTYEDDGNALLLAAIDRDPLAVSGTWRFRPDEGHVTGFEWGPEARPGTLVCGTDTGETYLLDVDSRESRLLARSPEGFEAHTFSSDGTLLAYYRDGVLTIRNLDDGSERGFDVPERGPYLGEARMLAFDDADEHLAYRFVDGEATQIGVVDVATGDLLWRTRSTAANASPTWLADDRVVFDRVGTRGTVREIVAVDPASGEESVLLEEREPERGIVSAGSPTVSPDGTRLAVALPLDGYDHVHVIDAQTGERRQLTAGPFEDRGVATSTPQWLDDRTLVFASNRRHPGQRQVFAVSVPDFDEADPGPEDDVRPVVERERTNVHPRPSPDGDLLAYVYADRERSPEIRVRAVGASADGPDAGGVDATGGSGTNASGGPTTPIQVTRSTVEDWPVEPIAPERVTFESRDGLEIESYLLDPRNTSAVPADATDLPAVVWVHGGPMRQMRDGWHPSRSYGLFYTYHQYLAHQGYVGLLVNYRGGIGFGKGFRQAIGGARGDAEMADVVAGAEFLADLGWVDPDAIAIWGLSYGGYAALQLLGTHPDTFAVGVNLAGIADMECYRDWAYETKYPRSSSAEEVRMGGEPHEVPEEWARASPKTHVGNYESPIYNFHGTGDRYVNFEQLDVAIEAFLEHGVEYEADYYPGEGHVFGERAVWERTFSKIERAFEEHLVG